MRLCIRVHVTCLLDRKLNRRLHSYVAPRVHWCSTPRGMCKQVRSQPGVCTSSSHAACFTSATSICFYLSGRRSVWSLIKCKNATCTFVARTCNYSIMTSVDNTLDWWHAPANDAHANIAACPAVPQPRVSASSSPPYREQPSAAMRPSSSCCSVRQTAPPSRLKHPRRRGSSDRGQPGGHCSATRPPAMQGQGVSTHRGEGG